MKIGIAFGLSASRLFPGLAAPPPAPGGPLTKTVQINNASGASQTDYPVMIAVTWVTGMRSDFYDLRFKDSDGTTALSHWIDFSTVVAGESCKVWVKKPSLTVAVQNITMEYGVETTDASDGEAVFSLFDDWSAGIDAGKWGTTITATATAGVGPSFEERMIGNVVTSTGARIQGIAGDGTNYFVSRAASSDAVNSTVYVYDYTLTLTGLSFAAPGHCYGLDVRQDRGTLIASAGSSAAGVVWEITKAGVKLREWDMNGVGYSTASQGGGVCYHSAGKFLVTSTGADFYIGLISVNDDGSFTIDDHWNRASLGTVQGIHFLDGKFYVLVDHPTLWPGSGTAGALYEMTLPPGGGAPTITNEFRFIGKCAGAVTNVNERQGLGHDGQSFLFMSVPATTGQLWRGSITARNELQLKAAATTSHAELQSVANFGLGFEMIVRGKMDGAFPRWGFTDATAQNTELLMRQTTANSIWGRRALAGTTSNTEYDAGLYTYADTNKEWRVNRQSGALKYFKDDGTGMVQLGTTITTSLPTIDLKASLRASTTTSTDAEVQSAWVAVRKVQPTEPTVSVL